MKIKDVVQEGVYDWFGNLNAQRKQAKTDRRDANAIVVPNEVKQMFIKLMRSDPYGKLEDIAPKVLTAIKAKGVNNQEANQLVNDVIADIKIDRKYAQGQDAEAKAAQAAGQTKQNIDAQVGSILKSHPSRKPPAPIPTEGTVLQVDGPGGQQYFKSFENRWFEKYGSAEDYSTSHEVKDPAAIAKLNDMVTQRAKKIPIIPDPVIPNKFIVDRRARLDKVRAARQQRAGR